MVIADSCISRRNRACLTVLIVMLVATMLGMGGWLWWDSHRITSLLRQSECGNVTHVELARYVRMPHILAPEKALAVRQLGAVGKEALPELEALSRRHADERVQRLAWVELMAVSCSEDVPLDGLLPRALESLDSHDRRERATAQQLFLAGIEDRRMRLADDQVLGALRRLQESDSVRIRLSAAMAHWRASRDDGALFTVLQRETGGDIPEDVALATRFMATAAGSVALAGGDIRNFVTLLMGELLNHEECEVRIAGIRSLAGLCRILADRKVAVAKELAAVLQPLLRTRSRDRQAPAIERAEAAMAVWEIDGHGDQAAAVLLDVLESTQEHRTLLMAAGWTGLLGVDAEPCMGVLKRLAEDGTDSAVRQVATEAVKAIEKAKGERSKEQQPP